MSVRKRTWKTASGEQRESWIVDYHDSDGDRHIESFARKKDADAPARGPKPGGCTLAYLEGGNSATVWLEKQGLGLFSARNGGSFSC